MWLGISLALNGVSLLLSRTFFALQRPWANTGLALGSLVASAAVSIALYRPFGIAGIVIGTFVGNVVLVALQIRLLRKETGGPLHLLPVLRSFLQVIVASVVAVLTATGVVLIGRIGTDALSDGTFASLVTMGYLGVAIVAGGVVYVGLAHDLGLRELETAGGRFVRLGARLRGMVVRLPGVRTLVAVGGRPGARRAGRATESALGVVALPLRIPTGLAVLLSRLLVGLVPAGPPVAVAGGPGDPGGAGPAGGVAPAAEVAPGRAGAGPSATGPTGTPPAGVAPRGAGRGTADDDGPQLYDAADEWPTIGQRGGTVDVPWPGVERSADEPTYSAPRWDDDVAPSRLEAYGVERAEGGMTPDQRARAEQRAQARRMIEAREAALERMAERERRRKEGGGTPKRGRRKRRD